MFETRKQAVISINAVKDFFLLYISFPVIVVIIIVDEQSRDQDIMSSLCFEQKAKKKRSKDYYITYYKAQKILSKTFCSSTVRYHTQRLRFYNILHYTSREKVLLIIKLTVHNGCFIIVTVGLRQYTSKTLKAKRYKRA